MRIGIAGTGRMAQRMALALRHLPGCRVTAVASADPARARAFAAEAGAAAEAQDSLAARADVDAVYVANRNADHATAVLAAIAAGKPVLVEKPLAPDPETVAAILDAARGAGGLVVENLWHLALPATRAMIDRAASLGPTPILSFSFGYPVTPEDHPALFANDAGVLRDRGCYGLALALRLFGPVDGLQASLRHRDGTDVAALVQMRHRSGALASVEVAFDALLANAATLSGPAGALRLAPSIGGEHLERLHPPAPGPGRAPGWLKSLPAARALNRLRKARGGETLSYGADPYLPVLAHFRDLVAAGARESPLIPLSLSGDLAGLIARARGAAA